jgi:hypothetical protein
MSRLRCLALGGLAAVALVHYCAPHRAPHASSSVATADPSTMKAGRPASVPLVGRARGAAPARPHLRVEDVPVSDAYGVPVPLSRGDGNVIGEVLDPDGVPLSDVRVQVIPAGDGAWVGGAIARSRADGTFAVERSPAGPVAVWVIPSDPRIAARKLGIQVSEAGTTDLGPIRLPRADELHRPARDLR